MKRKISKIIYAFASITCLGVFFWVLPKAAFTADTLDSGQAAASRSTGSLYGTAAPPWQVENPLNQTFAEAMNVATKAAEGMAKNLGTNINQYIQNLKLEKKQREILAAFYESYYFHQSRYPLTDSEAESLRKQVEEIYFKEALKAQPEIDLINFSDMRHVIKKVLHDMVLETATDGMYKTYYLTGEEQTSWTYKNGVLEGPAVHYSKNGEIETIDTYQNGYKINRRKYGPSGKLEFSQDYPYLLELTPQQPAAASENPSEKTGENPAA